MTTDAELEAEEREREASYSRVLPLKRFPINCPRCQRGMQSPKMLRRPHWRADGPKVCTTCILDESRQMRVDAQRKEAQEHARKRAEGSA